MKPAAARRGRDRRGNAAVEIALAMPMLLALLIGVLEFGVLGLRHMALTGAVRAGVDYAFQYDDAGGTQRAVRNAAGNDAIGVTTARFCECAGATVGCGGLCANGATQQIFIRVSAQETYVPIFLTYEMIASLLGPSTTLTATATFRFQ